MFNIRKILFTKKSWDIYSKKQEISDSHLTKLILDYCHANGIEVIRIDLTGSGYIIPLTLRVFCDKAKYWMLVKELSKEEYQIEIKKC